MMYQKGETVKILNQNNNGIPIIEGNAVLISYFDTKLYTGVDGNQYFLECWEIKFDDGRTAKRWLYPQCDIDATYSK